MNTLVAGHKYELRNMVGGEHAQTIQFVSKAEGSEVDGTTNEEVLAMMIDRMRFLNQKFSCRENAIVITKLEEARMWLEERTKERQRRGVEGTQVK